jgi:hypothetical protein
MKVMSQGGIKMQSGSGAGVQNEFTPVSGCPVNEVLDTKSVVEHINGICSSADLLLMSLNKLPKRVRQVLGDCPETVNLFLEYLPLLGDIAVQIKNKAIRIREAAEIGRNGVRGE